MRRKRDKRLRRGKRVWNHNGMSGYPTDLFYLLLLPFLCHYQEATKDPTSGSTMEDKEAWGPRRAYSS